MARSVQPYLYMQNRIRESRSAGFSLIEMLIVVVIIGLVCLFTFPRAGAIYDQAMVRSARTTITNLYITARTTARTTNKVAVVRFQNDRMWVETNNYSPLTTKDTTRTPIDLNEAYGVTLTTTVDSLRIDPRGMLLSSGTEYKYKVTRRGYSDSVMVNGYGRILR